MKSYNEFVSTCNKVIQFLKQDFISGDAVLHCAIDGEIVRFTFVRQTPTEWSDPHWTWEIVQITDVDIYDVDKVCLTPRTIKQRR